MSWISLCNLFCDMLNDCGATSITIHSFRIFKIQQLCCLPSLTCPYYAQSPQLQRPVPAECVESPRAIQFAIGSVVVVLQAQISPIFGIWDLITAIFTTFDVLHVQSARLLESHTRPTQCGKSHRAIRFAIWPLVAVLQAQISPIFGIWDPATAIFITFDML